jgi:hypothetical protein
MASAVGSLEFAFHLQKLYEAVMRKKSVVPLEPTDLGLGLMVNVQVNAEACVME